MSEYQYYEFQAVDRPLDDAARAQLRAISSRARISATSFVNSYDWGDLKADPLRLLEQHFDLFLYLANWGTRRLAMRLPRRLFEPADLIPFQLDTDLAVVRTAGDHVIIDITRDEVEEEDWDDGGGWLAALAPLRAEVLSGDLRLFSLLWLIQVENDWIADEQIMPGPGIAPLSGALAALAEFFGADPDLLHAAAAALEMPAEDAPADVEAVIRSLPEDEKVALLLRLQAGDDPHVGTDLRRRCRGALGGGHATRHGQPTAGELRQKAQRLAEDRRRAAAAREAAERARRAAEQAKARALHLAALAKRGEAAWREVESLIELRNASGYDKAAVMLADLGEIAAAEGRGEAFTRHLSNLRVRHAKKGKFIERLDAASLVPAPGTYGRGG